MPCLRTVGNSALKAQFGALSPCKESVKATAYKTLVRPRLEYGTCAWNPYTSLQVGKIEKVQRSAARFVVNDHRRTSSVTAMLEQLGWQSLESRRLQQQLTMMYKIKHNLVGILLPPVLLAPQANTRRTDHDRFTQPQCRVNAYAYSFYPRTVRAWNALPLSTVTSSSLATFKVAVQSQVLSAAPAYLSRY